MDVFIIGITVLSAVTLIFYIILFSFIFYWHLRRISYVIIPFIFTFEFFAMGFFMTALVSIIINFLPEFIRLAGL